MPDLALIIGPYVAVAVAVLGVIVIVRGLWRATSVQEGTGCPACDAHTGCGDRGLEEHDEGDRDEHGDDHKS